MSTNTEASKPMTKPELMLLLSERIRRKDVSDTTFLSLAELLCGLQFGRRGPDLKLRKTNAVGPTKSHHKPGWREQQREHQAELDKRAVNEIVRQLEKEKANGNG